MKKISFIFAGLVCLTLLPVQAQPIELERVYEGLLTTSDHPLDHYYNNHDWISDGEAPYIIGIKQHETTIDVYEDWDGDGIEEQHTKSVRADSMYFYNKEDFSLYKALQINYLSWISSVAKGIYTSDQNLTCFVANVSDGCADESCYGVFVYDENGVQIAKLDIDDSVIKTEIVKVGNNYKLFVYSQNHRTYVYALGGSTDDAQAVSNTSVPSSSARKIVKDGQVLVRTNTNTYTITGSEIK